MRSPLWFATTRLRGALSAGSLLSLVLLTAAPTAAAEARTIASYGDAISRDGLSPGWSFQRNARGGPEDPGSCVPLERIEVQSGRRTRTVYGVADDEGAPAVDRPQLAGYGSVFAARDADGAARWAIAAYTMQEDSAGEVWVNHGNLLNTGYPETAVQIYRNGELLFRASAKKDRVPLLFRVRLGRLKKGDAVRVAVAPGETAGTGGGRLSFVIEELPAGAGPADPVNILAPPITAAEPKRDDDGGHLAYSAKHDAQCREVLDSKPELVFIGDSITSRLPAELLRERYGKHRPVNLGIGGDWTQNVLWRVQNGTLDQAPVRVAVLLIGTNNLSNRFTPEEVAWSVGRIVEAIREKAPQSKALVLGVFPNGRSQPDSRANRNIRLTNALLAEMADGEAVFFLDIGDDLTEPDGSVSPEIMPDGLHVAGPGFVRWLDAMDPVLQRLLAGGGEGEGE